VAVARPAAAGGTTAALDAPAGSALALGAPARAMAATAARIKSVRNFFVQIGLMAPAARVNVAEKSLASR
jgi:hypothetical protein